MKRHNIIIIFLIFFFGFFISSDIVKASYAGGLYIRKAITNKDGTNKNETAHRTDLAKSGSYIYYTYETSSGIPAYCIDAHVPYPGDDVYKPALENDHKKNFYEYFLNTGSPEMPRGYILIGQFFKDNEKGSAGQVEGKTKIIDGGYYEYDYVEMQIALRLWNYHLTDYTYKKFSGYDPDEYDAFANAPNPTEPSVIAKGLTDAQTLFNYAGRTEDNPYTKENAGDGFNYENGFWEARSKTVDNWNGYSYSEKPQKVKDENGNTKYKLSIMFKTNIRAGGINTYGDSRSCEDLVYVHDGIEESANDYFYCNAVKAEDELFYARDVNYIHIETKENVYLDNQNFYFKLKYKDPREPNNFWLVHNPNKVGAQRMFVTEDNYGQLNLIVGEATPDVCVGCECDNSCPTTKQSKKSCKPKVEKSLCSGSVVIKDDADCIFGQNGNQSTINTVVSDSDNSNKHTYTTEANEYCNISCAEEITFTFPKEVSNIKAGTYFKFPLNTNVVNNNSYINATGVRTCRATLDMSKFNKTVANNTGDSNAIAKEIIDSNLTYNSNENYSYTQQNKALQSLYDGISETYSGNSSGSCDCDMYGNNCSTKYTASVTIFDKKFSYSGSKCGTSTFSSDELKYNGISLSTFKKNLKNGIDSTVSSIKNALQKMEKCTNTFNENKETTYDFSPNIKYSYDEPYSKFFTSNYNKSLIKEESTKGNANFDELSISYYTVDNNQKSTLTTSNYAALSENSGNAYIESKETKTISSYTSPLQFYSAIPNGSAIIKNGANYIDYENNVYTKFTKMDQDTYPIALKTPESIYSYSFAISQLGDFSLTTSSNSESELGRIDKLLSSSDRTYYCTYEIKNDVTTPDKPNFYYRNISLNNINPNNRELGKNWTNEKAKATLCEIDGGKYNNGDCTSQANTSPESTYETPEYSFTLTPENMQAIKKYNQEKEKDSNGYADFNMIAVNSDGTTNTGDNKLWFKSNFIWDSKTCQNCFTSKNEGIVTTFTAWSDNVEKLSGTGPAWK